MAESIMLGRETLSRPKIHCEILPARKLRDTLQCIASWYGSTLLNVTVTGIRVPFPGGLQQLEEIAKQNESRAGLICHKFVRGGPELHAEADCLTITTNEGAPSPTIAGVVIGKPEVKFIRGTWEQLLTMKIIERL